MSEPVRPRAKLGAACFAFAVVALVAGCGAAQSTGGEGTTSPSVVTAVGPSGGPAPVPDPGGGDPGATADQEDWDAQTGDQWDEFNEAYLDAWDTGCENLFSNSPDGNFYEDNVQYDVTDCQGLVPGDASEASDLPAIVPLDPVSDGEVLGEHEGCVALFQQEGVTSLNWGTESYTELDCP